MSLRPSLLDVPSDSIPKFGPVATEDAPPPQKPPEPPKQAAEPEQEESIYDLIQSLGGPSQVEIEQLKAAHGEINLIPTGSDQIYIYRPLKRTEWIGLNTEFAQKQGMTEDQKKEVMVSKCLIWPRIPMGGFTFLPAGLVDTLHTAIMLSSCFYSEQAVMNLVVRL